MRTKKNTIILNGKEYDAVSGKPLTSHPQKPVHKSRVNIIHNPPVVKPTTIQVRASAKSSPAPTKKIAVQQTKASTDSHKVHVRTDRSHTLRRSGLKKPAPSTTKHGVAPLVSQPKHRIIGSLDAASATKLASRSKHISKFAQHATVTHRTEVIAVKTVPEGTSTKKSTYSIEDTPPALRPAKQSAKIPTTTNLFEDALAVATSHRTTRAKSKRKKHFGLNPVGLTILSGLVVLGVAMHANAPRIALLKARAHIGFNASLPKYQPSGFGLKGGVQYQAGLVLANFRSNSDDRTYTLTQTTATTDNYNLANVLEQHNQSFHTELVNGYRVYITSKGATWVMHGVRYSIEGNAGLNTEQLTRIVASI